MCQDCMKTEGTRSAVSILSSMIVRQKIDLPTAVEQVKAEVRAMPPVATTEELAYMDGVIDAAAVLLAESAQALREAAERMSPTIPTTTEGLIP